MDLLIFCKPYPFFSLLVRFTGSFDTARIYLEMECA